MNNAADLLNAISGVVWGPATIILLVGTGLYLTLRLGFVQFRLFAHSLKCVSGAYDDPHEQGDVSHFRALAAALSATIGTGNIAGVATAIALGGPGAIFWMWITALVGMATKFTSCALALRFRDVHDDGSVSGGPMYYLEKGFAPRWLLGFAGDARTRRWGVALAVSFALFGMCASFGIGNMVQANSVVDGLKYVLPADWHAPGFALGGGAAVGPEEVTSAGVHVSYLALAVGLTLAVLVGAVILGGIRRIAAVAAFIVPFMCVVYVVGALVVLALRMDRIPEALTLIVRHAFTPYAAGGGAVGIAVAQAMRYGVARGVFSNEAGLGSAPIAHAAAKTREMVREGAVAMLGPFIDTLVVCTMTALVIMVTDARDSGLTSSSLTAAAFDEGLFNYGHHIVGFGLIFFAFSTMISWSYYGDRCAEYLLGPRAILPYRCVFVALIVVGAVGGLRTIWTIADILNGLMAIPNLIGLLALSGLVATQMRDYTRRLQAGELDPPLR